MNDILIDNTKIVNLKKAIVAFKNYDKNRKLYYSEKLRKLGELESFIQELEHNNGIEDLPGYIRNLKSSNTNLRKRIQSLNNKIYMLEELSNQEILNIFANVSGKEKKLLKIIHELHAHISHLKEQLRATKDLKDTYLTTLCKLQSNKNII